MAATLFHAVDEHELVTDQAAPAYLVRAQLIERIMEINTTAGPDFLHRFDADQLRDYLDHLLVGRHPGSRWVRRGSARAAAVHEPAY